VIDDDHVWGLGSADTKGAIAAALIALDGITPRDTGVLFSGDEEAGSGVLAHFLGTPHAAAIEQVIVCEPTARTAGLAHRGVLACRATLSGPGGHSSRADHVQKPLAKLARLAAALDELGEIYRARGPAGMTGTCLNIAALAGGIAFNVIPSRGELTYSLRPYPGFPRAAWDAEVAARAAAIDPAIAITAEIDQPAFACARPDELAALVRPFVRAIEPLQYWTEAALYAAAGIDAIVVGPGDIAYAHAADERVPIADLGWAVELYRAILGAPVTPR
jgi:acetylornithine deacetylase